MALHVARTIGADLLGRAGLAGDAVALDGGLLAAAARDDLLEQADERLVGRRLDCAAHLCRALLLVDGAVCIRDTLDDVGLQQHAVIGDGRHGRDELQRRHRDALADGHRRDVRVAHVVRVEEQAALLARQLDARRRAEAEELRVVRELLRAEPQADLRKARVERLLDDVGERDRAEARAAPVLDAAARDHDVARVDEYLIRRDDLLLQGSGRDNRLERRARLVDEGDGAVLPDLRRVVGEAVRVVGGPRGHREDLARLRIHDDAGDGLRVVFCHRAIELLLDDELDAAIERELDVLAVLALVLALAREDRVEYRPVLAVRRQVLLLDLPLQEAVEALFDAIEALVVRADEAENVGPEDVIWIVALGLIAEADAVRV